jgi:hypothetical protein
MSNKKAAVSCTSVGLLSPDHESLSTAFFAGTVSAFAFAHRAPSYKGSRHRIFPLKILDAVSEARAFFQLTCHRTFPV